MYNNSPYYPPPPPRYGPSPETESTATTAMIIEIIFGFFGFLGLGNIYAGRILMGILSMVGWWLFVGLGGFLSTITAGIAACFFAPIFLIVPIYSGIEARKHVLRTGATGSCLPVILIGGGGCAMMIGIIVVILLVTGVGIALLSEMGIY